MHAVVGPPTEVIRTMGDKVLARRTAEACNIPVIPGTNTHLQNLEEAHDFISRFVPGY